MSKRFLARVAAAAVAVAGVVGIAGTAGTAQAATPGDRLMIETESGQTVMCTLGDITPKHDRLYGVTAGHCLQPSIGATAIWSSSGELLWERSDGGLESAYSESSYFPNLRVTDFSYFPLKPGVRDTGTVSSRPWVGVPPVDQLLAQFGTAPNLPRGNAVPVSDLHPGDIVCKDGARTGRTCGPVLAVNPGNQDIFVLVPALSGDSGGALTVNRGNVLHPVGVLSGGSPVFFNVFDSTSQIIGRI